MINALVGRDDPWIPRRLKRIGFEKEKAKRVRDKFGNWLRRIDKLVSTRAEWAAGSGAQWLAALFCIGLSVLMVPLEAIPFAVALPAAAIMFFGLGLTARDGILMILGFIVTGASVVLAFNWLGGGSGEGSGGAQASAALDLGATFLTAFA